MGNSWIGLIVSENSPVHLLTCSYSSWHSNENHKKIWWEGKYLLAIYFLQNDRLKCRKKIVENTPSLKSTHRWERPSWIWRNWWHRGVDAIFNAPAWIWFVLMNEGHDLILGNSSLIFTLNTSMYDIKKIRFFWFKSDFFYLNPIFLIFLKSKISDTTKMSVYTIFNLRAVYMQYTIILVVSEMFDFKKIKKIRFKSKKSDLNQKNQIFFFFLNQKNPQPCC